MRDCRHVLFYKINPFISIPPSRIMRPNYAVMVTILKLKLLLPCQKELINCTLIIEGKQSPTEA